ncbi:MAG: ferrous iron transport protein A [Desulfamplus sp.]
MKYGMRFFKRGKCEQRENCEKHQNCDKHQNRGKCCGRMQCGRIPLRFMKDGERGVIVAVNATGEMGRRIRDMGLVPGAEIAVQGRAPLYDPVALRIMGFTLTLRNNEADYIMVETVSEQPSIEENKEYAIA